MKTLSRLVCNKIQQKTSSCVYSRVYLFRSSEILCEKPSRPPRTTWDGHGVLHHFISFHLVALLDSSFVVGEKGWWGWEGNVRNGVREMGNYLILVNVLT